MKIDFSISTNPYFKTEEVAEIYGISEETVRRWAKTKKLPAKRIGKRWFFSKSAIYTEKSEGDGAKLLQAERQSCRSPFDLLKGEEKIDVKSSKLKKNSTGNHWYFTYDFGSSNKERSGTYKKGCRDYCDWFLFMCYDKDWKKLLRAYLIPNSEVIDKKDIAEGHYKINIDDEEISKYRLLYLDIPAYLRKKGRKYDDK